MKKILFFILIFQFTSSLVSQKKKFSHPSNFKEGPEIVASVLSKEPFVLEILVCKENETSFSKFGIIENLDYDEKEIQDLEFNTMISGRLYSFYYAARELSCGTGIRNIQKIEVEPSAYEDKKILMLYTPLRQEFWELGDQRYQITPIHHESWELGDRRYQILQNGKILYNSSIIKQLNQTELNQLLKSYEEIASLPIDIDVSYYDSLQVFQNKYHKIDIVKQFQSIQPFLYKLHEIFNLPQYNHFVLHYLYAYPIKDWIYGESIHLSQIDLRDRKKNTIIYNLRTKELPQELLNFLQTTIPVFKENEKLYFLRIKETNLSKTLTWGTIASEEITSSTVPGPPYYYPWPTHLVRLKNLELHPENLNQNSKEKSWNRFSAYSEPQTKGYIIPFEELNKSPKDYKYLIGKKNPCLFYLEENVLYQGLYISLQ